MRASSEALEEGGTRHWFVRQLLGVGSGQEKLEPESREDAQRREAGGLEAVRAARAEGEEGEGPGLRGGKRKQQCADVDYDRTFVPNPAAAARPGRGRRGRRRESADGSQVLIPHNVERRRRRTRASARRARRRRRPPHLTGRRRHPTPPRSHRSGSRRCGRERRVSRRPRRRRPAPMARTRPRRSQNI